MATKILPSGNGSHVNSKGRRSEKRGRRERCRTQVYEGGSVEDAAASPEQRGFRPRHKSCDPKVDVKSKRRSLPSGPEEFAGSESDSPEEDTRKWTRRQRRTRAEGHRTNESGNSSANQKRNSYNSQKNLNVPDTSVTTQPSSDSAIYMRQRGQINNSSNGSKGKFQKLEERRRQRLEMAVTSDEEGVNLSDSYQKPNPQKTLTNGKSDNCLGHQPQIAFAQSFTPSTYNDPQQTSFFNFAGPVSPKLEMDSEDLKTKRPVSMLKAQFENQMQTPPAASSVSRVSCAALNSGGPSWRSSNSSIPAGRRLSAESITTSASVTLRQPVNWQAPHVYDPPSVSKPVNCQAIVRACDPPAVSIKPVKASPVLCSSVTSTKSISKSYQPLNDRSSKLPKDHNFNDADSLDELLESNRDYLGLSNDEDKVAVKANIKQTMKTMQKSSSGKPNTELGAVFSKRRISEPLVQVKTMTEVTQSVQHVTKPSWPRNILSSLSPTIASKAVINNVPANNGTANISITIPNQQPVALTSPSSENLDDLWIPRKIEKENSVKIIQRQRPVVLPIVSTTREQNYTYHTPMMVISDMSSSMPMQTTGTMPPPQMHQAQSVDTIDGLGVPQGPDGMFSDVDYNIEVSERVKKWEFLMHEKNMPNRKNETPDKINLVETEESSQGGQVLSPRSKVFPAIRLPVIDEKSEAKSVLGYPGGTIDHFGSNVFTNSGGDLMLSQDQLWTYPGHAQNSPALKDKPLPHGNVRHQRQDTIIGDEVWHSDWFFKGYMNKANQSPQKVSPVEQKRYSSSYGSSPKMSVTEYKPAQLSPVVQKRYSSSYGSSPKMTRKIVYEPMKADASPTRLNPFYGPSSDSEITNPLYTPLKTGILSLSPTKMTPTRPSDISTNGSHRRQDSDEQIWKEIERMTMYARAIAGAASSTAKSQQSSLPKSQMQKNPTRRSAYEPLTLHKSTTDLFVPLSVDVGAPKKSKHERFSSPFDNVPLVASVKVYQPQRPSKPVTTKSIQYQHVPVTDKYQRPEALDEVLEEITTSLEKKPFSPKNKSPGLSSSSQWSTGTPEKPPLSPDIISMTTSQHLNIGNDPSGGRPSSMSFPHAQPTFYAQIRDNERRQQEKNPKFMNLAHGKEYQLDHDLLKQKLYGTGLVERHIEEDQLTDTGSNKAIDSDSGSQQSMTHINNAIRELRHLATDVESRIEMIKTRLVTTKEEDLDTVLSTLRRCSSNLASAKSGYAGSGSAKNRKTKLNDALSELERIYESLELKSDDMESRGKRDYVTSQGSQWSITSLTDISSLGSYPQSSSEVHTDTNLSDYKWQSPRLNRPPKRQNFYTTDGLEQLTQALESSGYVENNNSWRPQDGEETPRATNTSNFNNDGISQQRFSSGIDTYTPTESLSALSSEESSRRPRSRRKEVDLTDERSYRKIRTKSATRIDTNSPHMSPSSTDYSSQRTRPEMRSRTRCRQERDTGDLVYRNLRRDIIIEHPKPPPRSSSLHRKGKGRSDEGSDSESHLCNAETQTCHVDDGDSSELDENERQGRSKERSHASRKIAKEEQKRRRSLGRGVAKMVERFSSSEDERQPKRRLKHSRSAPDLSEQAFYSDTYNSKGEIMSTETDTNKEDDNKKVEENHKAKKKSTNAKSQTPRTVKQRNEAKSRIRSNQIKNENFNGISTKMVNPGSSAQNKSLLKTKNAVKIASSSDQTPLGSSCEGSPASARLLIHRRTKRVPLATISTTSTSGEESATGSKTSVNQSMVLPQGGVIRRQIPADLPRGNSVKLRQKISDVSKEEREERSKSVPELCAKFETDPTRLKSILGTLRKSFSAGGVPIENFQKKSFCSEPNLRDNRHRNRVISKETLLLNWNLDEDTEKGRDR